MSISVSFNGSSNLSARLVEKATNAGIITPADSTNPDDTVKSHYVEIDSTELDGRHFKSCLGIEKTFVNDDTAPGREKEPINEAKLTQHPILYIREEGNNFSSCTFHVTEGNKLFFNYGGTWPDQGVPNMLLWLEGTLEEDKLTLFKHDFGPNWIDVRQDAKLAPFKDDFEARINIFLRAFSHAASTV